MFNGSKRAADGGKAAACCIVNGLMRATESVSALVAVDGGVPVTVRLVCRYEAERAVLNRQFGWQRRYNSSCPIYWDGAFCFLKGTVFMSFIRLAERWRGLKLQHY